MTRAPGLVVVAVLICLSASCAIKHSMTTSIRLGRRPPSIASAIEAYRDLVMRLCARGDLTSAECADHYERLATLTIAAAQLNRKRK